MSPKKKTEQEEEKAVIMELQQKAELQRILEQLPEKMLEDIITLMKERNVIFYYVMVITLEWPNVANEPCR